MTAPTAFPLRYVLPTTALTVSAAVRLAVVVDEHGGHLEPEVAVSLSAPWHPSPLTSVRRALRERDGSLPSKVPGYAVAGSLRIAFDRRHPRAAALIEDLSARAEQYLAGMRMGEEVGQVVTFGQALEVVERELAAADRTRREWISRQGGDLRQGEWDLSGRDVVTVAEPSETLPADLEIPEGQAREIARDFGVLVVISNDRIDDHPRGRNNAAGIGVYRRLPDSIPDHSATGAGQPWVRDPALSRLRLADVADPVADIPQQRSGPDATRLVPLGGHVTGADPALEAAVRAARTQLELLDCSDEYSRIASTHYRDAEIAALQHEMRLAYLPRQRQGD